MGARRTLVLAVALALVATAAGAPGGGPEPARALHATAVCGTLAGYELKVRNVGCRFARRWAPRSLYQRRRPPGWRCSYASRRSKVRMFCYAGSKAYFMER